MVDNLILLWLAALPLMGSPGPATLSLAALCSSYGVSASLGYLAGIIAGTTTVLLVVASGVSGVILAIPGVVPLVTTVAAAYIAYLAWRIATAPPPAKHAERRRAPSFVGGYILAVGNPKAFAALGAVYSSATVVRSDLILDTALKVAALITVIVGVNAAWLLFGSAFSPILSSPRSGRAVNVCFAILLVLSVLAAILM